MNRSDELTAMRGEVGTVGIARSVMRIAWQVLCWPLFAFLLVFEPIVGPGHHPLVQVRPQTSTKPTRISGLLPSVVRGGTVESKLIHPLPGHFPPVSRSQLCHCFRPFETHAGGQAIGSN